MELNINMYKKTNIKIVSFFLMLILSFVFITGADVSPPTINFTSQTPNDINTFNVIGNPLIINYTLNDTSGLDISTIKLYYKANSSTSNIEYYQNGTAHSGYFSGTYTKNITSTFSWTVYDNQIYMGTYNFGEISLESTTHKINTTLTNNEYYKINLMNVSSTRTYGIFEIMVNSTATANPLNVYYCNSSYTSGRLSLSSNCVLFGTLTARATFNHTHTSFSKHQVIPFAIVSGKIGTIKITSNSNFFVGGSKDWDIYNIRNFSRTGAIAKSSNNGITWTNQVYTIDAHVHQYNSTDYFYYYVCANDTLNNAGCSSIRTDLMQLAGLPPTSPVVYSPINTSYKGNININYTASISPNGYDISFYNLSLLNKDYSFNKTIITNNSLILGYIWTSPSPNGQFIVRVEAIDNLSQSSFGYSENFTIDTISPKFTYIPANKTIFYGHSFLGVNFTGTDLYFDSYYLNDTSKFSINSSGYLMNTSSLNSGTFNLKIYLNDTSGNTNFTSYKINILNNFVTNSTSIHEWTSFQRTLEGVKYYPEIIDMHRWGLKWSFPTSFKTLYSSYFASSTIKNGRVYTTSPNYTFWIINFTTGNKICNYTTGGLMRSGPAIDGGYAAFGSADKKFYVVNDTNCALKWTYLTGGIVYSSPLINDGIVYVGSADKNVYAFNLLTGSKIWTYLTGGIVYSNPAIENGILYVGSRDFKMYALNATTGTHIWNYTTGNLIDSSPIAYQGKLLFGSLDKKVYSLNASNGALLCSTTLSDNIYGSSGVIDNGILYFGARDDKLNAINISNCKKMWNYTVGNDIDSTPAISNGVVWIGALDNKLYAINSSTGSLIWNYYTKYQIKSNPTIADGTVLIGSGDYRVYAFGSGETPSVVINTPEGSKITTLNFNITATDNGEVSTCRYSFNGGIKNYTMTNLTATEWNATNTTLSYGTYNVTFYCNDTLDNINYTERRTFYIDATQPNITISNTNNTLEPAGDLTVKVNYTASDTYLKSCYFTLRKSTGALNNYPENTSLNCSATSKQITALTFGTFVVQFWAEDYAGNLDDANFTFRTYSEGGGGGGGGGGQQQTTNNNETLKEDIIEIKTPKNLWEDVPFTKEFIIVIFSLLIVGLIFIKSLLRFFKRKKEDDLGRYNKIVLPNSK